MSEDDMQPGAYRISGLGLGYRKHLGAVLGLHLAVALLDQRQRGVIGQADLVG